MINDVHRYRSQTIRIIVKHPPGSVTAAMAPTEHDVSVLLVLFLSQITEVALFSNNNFAAKTAYDWAHPANAEDAVDNKYMQVSVDGSVCTAVHITSVLRHGARFPGRGEIQHMTLLQKRLENKVDNTSFSFINDWNNPFDVANESLLSDLGRKEQRTIGERYMLYFRSLLRQNLNRTQLVSSSKERSTSSAKSFFHGLQSNVKEDLTAKMNMKINDETLRFYKRCARWLHEVNNNKVALSEYVKFGGSSAVNKLLASIKDKLGLNETLLTSGDLEVMYKYCAYELEFYGSSPWCGLFEEKDLPVVEYLRDLLFYWEIGYGHKISERMSCPLVREIFEMMDSVIDAQSRNKTYVVGSFQFAHIYTLAPLYSVLGLFKDKEPLLASNYDSQGQRKFLTSDIIPFSANIMFALYKCPDVRERTSQYAVQVFVNEKPEVLPTCGKTVCSYNEIRTALKSSIDMCDFEEVCVSTSGGSDLKSALTVIIVMMISCWVILD